MSITTKSELNQILVPLTCTNVLANVSG